MRRKGERKIVKKWVYGAGTRHSYVTTFGFKRLFNKGPLIIPYIHRIHQKKPNPGEFRSMEFNPSDYNLPEAAERRNEAYNDALNHRNLYRELIKRGVYPTGTKVRIKKGKHSNFYTLELSTPQVKDFVNELHKKKVETDDYGHLRKGEMQKMLNQRESVQYAIEHIVRKRGRMQSKNQEYEPLFDEDISADFNYGIDKDGRVVYFDQHIIREKLPFENRKIDDSWERYKKNLENKLTTIITIAGLGAGIFFLSSNITGNVIGNLNQTSSNWIGGILFVVGLISAFVYFRRRK